VYFIKSNRIL